MGPTPAHEGYAMRQRMMVDNLPVEFQPYRTIDRAITGPELTLD